VRREGCERGFNKESAEPSSEGGVQFSSRQKAFIQRHSERESASGWRAMKYRKRTFSSASGE
jgi:hypothetical protein